MSNDDNDYKKESTYLWGDPNQNLESDRNNAETDLNKEPMGIKIPQREYISYNDKEYEDIESIASNDFEEIIEPQYIF